MTDLDPEDVAMMDRIGIPREFRHATLDAFEATTDEQRGHLEWARGFVENISTSHRNAILCGNVGTGKTHLGCAVAAAAAERVGAAWWVEFHATWKERVRYVRAPNVFREVRRTFQRDARRSEADVLRELVEPRLLVMDEVGVQRGSDFELNFMDDVLDGRYASQVPVVLISNLSAEGLRDLLGARIVDRLKQPGCDVLHFTGASYRSRMARDHKRNAPA